MDKLKLAHDWYMKHSESASFMYTEVDQAWQYADAMQAEAEKRECKERPDAILNNEKKQQEQKNYHDALVEIGLEEWQPDWSQAPDDKITHWTMEKDKRYSWWIGEPKKDSQNHYESIENANCSFYGDAPSFNYQGNWQDSLRKRPE